MKKFLKISSLILVLSLLVNSLPMNVFAAKYRNWLLAEDDIPMVDSGLVPEEAIVPEEVTVLEEVEESRTEYSKEFKLSNGLYAAAVYAAPVHYYGRRTVEGHRQHSENKPDWFVELLYQHRRRLGCAAAQPTGRQRPGNHHQGWIYAVLLYGRTTDSADFRAGNHRPQHIHATAHCRYCRGSYRCASGARPDRGKRSGRV